MTTDTDTAPRFTARIITLFPEVFPGPLGVSLAGKALEAGIWRLQTHPLRDFALDKHASVDDTPAGGGPGMVIRPDVAARAIDHVRAAAPDAPVIYPSPRGRPADQALMRDLAAAGDVVLLCGRFEGLDERVFERRPVEEISMGDFVLSGGEIAAMAIVDAVVRLLPGVVGDPATLAEESFEDGLLEYPQYTRPAEWEGLEIPSVLMSGHHEKIRAWRRTAAEELTRERRPDLWSRYKSERGKP